MAIELTKEEIARLLIIIDNLYGDMSVEEIGFTDEENYILDDVDTSKERIDEIINNLDKELNSIKNKLLKESNES